MLFRATLVFLGFVFFTIFAAATLSMGLAEYKSSAQTVTVTLKPNTPFDVQWEHDGKDNARFRMWCDGGIIKNYAPSELTKSATADAEGFFTYTAKAPGLALGEHDCFVSAYNVVDASLPDAKGSAVRFSVAETIPQKVPAAPVRFRILVTIGGGGQ